MPLPVERSLVPPRCAHLDLHLAGETVEAVLRTLWEPLRTHPAVNDHETVWLDLLKRQAAGPVAITSTVAIPHARTVGVNELLVIGGRHVTGVSFDEAHPAVRLIILIATPAEHVSEYLTMVARLSRRLRIPDVLSGLLTTEDPAAFNERLFGTTP